MQPRGVVVIGGSAGGLEALVEVVGGLPVDLPAAVLVTIHIGEHARTSLPQILLRCGPLEAVHPVDGEPLRAARIYLAPPGRHLLMPGGKVGLSEGPRINRHRPAVDAMFGSAARWAGDGVVAAGLSGVLDDGAVGAALTALAGGRKANRGQRWRRWRSRRPSPGSWPNVRPWRKIRTRRWNTNGPRTRPLIWLRWCEHSLSNIPTHHRFWVISRAASPARSDRGPRTRSRMGLLAQGKFRLRGRVPPGSRPRAYPAVGNLNQTTRQDQQGCSGYQISDAARVSSGVPLTPRLTGKSEKASSCSACSTILATAFGCGRHGVSGTSCYRRKRGAGP